MNEICIFTFSSRSNRINSRVLMSRNVAEFHFCVQHATGHATKFLSYPTKTGQFIAKFGIWNRKRTESVRRFNRRFAHTLKLATEPNRTAVRFGSVRTDFRFGSLFSLLNTLFCAHIALISMQYIALKSSSKSKILRYLSYTLYITPTLTRIYNEEFVEA